MEEILRLMGLYDFRDREVTGFLKRNHFLIPLLFEAHDEIKKRFENAALFLEVIADPDASDDRELYALVATHLPPEAALEELERLDQEWWLAAMDRARGKLCIDIEFT
jgi:hypothetical protein